MELRGLLRRMRTRSRPGDDLREQQRQAAIKTRVLARDLFDQMSEAEQDEALGPDLAKAVRNGEVELGDLVTAEAAWGAPHHGEARVDCGPSSGNRACRPAPEGSIALV